MRGFLRYAGNSKKNVFKTALFQRVEKRRASGHLFELGLDLITRQRLLEEKRVIRGVLEMQNLKNISELLPPHFVLSDRSFLHFNGTSRPSQNTRRGGSVLI